MSGDEGHAKEALPLLFRMAEARDVGDIVRLVTSAYRGDASRVGWTTEADLLDGQRTDDESVLALMASPERAGVVLAERDGELVACCHIERVDSREGSEGREGYFGMFSVRPDQQSGGVGRLVLAEAERLLATRFDCDTCSMTVIDVRHELIAWYERRGYSRTGMYKPFPYGDERFGIPKHPSLRFEVLKKTLR